MLGVWLILASRSGFWGKSLQPEVFCMSSGRRSMSAYLCVSASLSCCHGTLKQRQEGLLQCRIQWVPPGSRDIHSVPLQLACVPPLSGKVVDMLLAESLPYLHCRDRLRVLGSTRLLSLAGEGLVSHSLPHHSPMFIKFRFWVHLMLWRYGRKHHTVPITSFTTASMVPKICCC